MTKLIRLGSVMAGGKTESYPKGQIFHSIDFEEVFYILKSGYVKRYQVTTDGKKIIESIYGPDYFFPLSQAYSSLLQFVINQDSLSYIYEAMTDIELQGINAAQFKQAMDEDSDLYIDLFYEAGRRLKANINRLASNALKSDFKKVAHQLVCLAEEFPDLHDTAAIKITVPLEPIDMAEQLNISLEAAEQAMKKLEKQGAISSRQSTVTITDMALLKDAYL